MPAWETGDLDVAARAGARTTSTCSQPFVDARRQGRGDQPDLRDDDAPRVPGAAARGAAAAAREGSPRLVRDPSRAPVGDPQRAALQHRLQVDAGRRRSPTTRPATCARRRVGFKGRDLLRKIPGVAAEADDGVLRPRRHLRDEGRGLRAVERQGRAEGVRRHEGRRAPRCGRPTARSPRCSSSSTRAGSRCTRCRSWRAPTARTASRRSSSAGRGGEPRATKGGRGAMKTVERDEILDYATYEERRGAIRAAAMRGEGRAPRPRRRRTSRSCSRTTTRSATRSRR